MNSGAASRYPNAIKLMSVFVKRSDYSNAQFYDYWLNQHGPFVVEQIKVLGGYRYVQSHTDYSTATAELRASRGQTATAEQGISSVWFSSAQDLMNRLSTDDGKVAFQNIANDEANFLDLPSCSHFYVLEFPEITNGIYVGSGQAASCSGIRTP
jgi:hypothetical protein